MPGVEHHVSVHTGTALVTQIGLFSNYSTSVETYQARCDCGWLGPRRTREWDARDDTINHQKQPTEDQQ